MLCYRSPKGGRTIMNIINDFVPINLIVNIKLPNKRAYEITWSLAKLQGYETLDDFINDIVLTGLEMYPEGATGFNIDWGFKREKEQAKIAR